jgi:hypothetical protein
MKLRLSYSVYALLLPEKVVHLLSNQAHPISNFIKIYSRRIEESANS